MHEHRDGRIQPMAILIVLALISSIISSGNAVGPVFTKPSPDVNNENHKIYLDETAAKGSDVLILMATDADTSAATLTFAIDPATPSATTDIFEVAGDKLKVKTIGTFDLDVDKENAVKTYRIILTVADDSSTASVTTSIYINDVNEFMPVFDNPPATIYVAESTTAGTSVGKVLATDADAANTISYAMAGDAAAIFEINSNTGVIIVKTGAVLNPAMEYSGVLTTSDSGTPIKAAATNIKFMIAKKPIFAAPKSGAVASVNENEATNTVVYTVSVTDGDTANSGLTLTILSQDPNVPTDMFKLDTNNVLKTNGAAFDTETRKKYELKFRVTDGKFTVDSATLTVNVNDLNDNSPIITPVSAITINENMAKDSASVVVDVAANDADVSDPNNKLTYAIISGNTDTTFDIVASTGVIFLLKAPMSSTYTLKVKVSDGGTPARSSEIDITVNIDDTAKDECESTPCKNSGKCTSSLNSFSCDCTNTGFTGTTCEISTGPVFTKPSPDVNSDNHKITLDETAANGDDVIQLMATDADTLPSGLTFAIDPATPSTTTTIFEVVGDILKVKSTGSFDLDVDKENAVKMYQIILTVADDFSTASVTTSIYINDVNDNIPVFDNPPATIYVAESTPPGTSVGKILAKDADAATTISYAMAGEAAAIFEINSNTGVITVKTGMVLNTAAEYSGVLTASDNGTPIRAAATNIKFMIAKKPIFAAPKSGAVASVNENEATNTVVYTVSVTDGDTANSGLTLKILSQDPNVPIDMFKLDTNNVLRTNKAAFDAEPTSKKYELKFQVTDGKFTVDSATLTVNVNDLNDNSPIITPVSPITINENLVIGSASVVVDVAATDADVSDPNNKLTYAIISGNTDTTFDIVSSTGAIFLLKAPMSSTYTLKVKVSDGGTPARSSEIDITVNIDDTAKDECENTPCKNSGKCTSSLNSFSCDCTNTGFTGTTCETNINDCANTPCKNGGTCADKIKAFECTCAVGFTGATCETVCSNNKYGAGCSQTCNCNAARLIDNVGSQTCDTKTGACKCNSKWTGAACETDVNECTNTEICKATPNKVCENIDDGYKCVCQVGYKEETDKTCTKTTTPSFDPADNEYRLNIKWIIEWNCVLVDLLTPSKHDPLVAVLEALLQSKIRAALRVRVFNLRCGSLLFDSQIIIPNTDDDKARAASDIQSIRNGDTLTVNGVNTKAAAVTVNGYALDITSGTDNTGTKVCRVYITLVTCPAKQTCQYIDNTASCRPIQEDDDDDDNNDLILGLGLGLGLPLVVMVIVAVVCCFMVYKRRQHRENEYRRERERDRYIYDNKDDYRRSYDRPRSDVGDYLEKREFYGMPSYRY